MIRPRFWLSIWCGGRITDTENIAVEIGSHGGKIGGEMTQYWSVKY